MKKTRLIIWLLHITSFIFETALPIILFGNVLPYTHEAKSAGFTRIGYIAVCVLIVLAAFKIVRCIDKTHAFRRQIIISALILAVWIFIGNGLEYLADILNGLCAYWGRVTMFIIIGEALRLLAVKLEEDDKT